MMNIMTSIKTSTTSHKPATVFCTICGKSFYAYSGIVGVLAIKSK